MKRKNRPSGRWPASQIILVVLVATPFVLLIGSIVASTQYDRALTAEVNARFQPVECEVLDVGRRQGSRRERIHSGSQQTQVVDMGFDPIIEYRYEWHGVSYRSRSFAPTVRTFASSEAEAFERTYAVGTRHQCKFDPEQPERAFIAW